MQTMERVKCYVISVNAVYNIPVNKNFLKAITDETGNQRGVISSNLKRKK